MNKKLYEVTANWQVISISLNKIVESVVMTGSSSLWLNVRKTADYERGQNFMFLLFKQRD